MARGILVSHAAEAHYLTQRPYGMVSRSGEMPTHFPMQLLTVSKGTRSVENFHMRSA